MVFYHVEFFVILRNTNDNHICKIIVVNISLLSVILFVMLTQKSQGGGRKSTKRPAESSGRYVPKVEISTALKNEYLAFVNTSYEREKNDSAAGKATPLHRVLQICLCISRDC